MPYYQPLKYLNRDERSRTAGNLLKLRRQLDDEIPKKTATDTLLLATWNIKEFADNRRKESLHYIAEIISRFDLVAVQEVKENVGGLQKLMSLLNLNWDYIYTDITEGKPGNMERMAFIYDKSKISFKKMVGKVVLDFDNLLESEKGGLQFARTPFCMALQAGWFKFVLNTVHIYYGTTLVADRKKRAKEILTLTKLLSKRADNEDVSYILLGDFNIPKSKPSDIVMQALDGSDFVVPDAIREHPSDLGGTNHYDQIAFRIKLNENMTVFSDEQKAGAFNFAQTIYRDNLEDAETYKQYFPANQKNKTGDELLSYYKTHWRTRQMSDHLPLWVELKIDFSDQYLEKYL